MPTKGEIKSEKILLKDIFKMWFRIPEYQRPYVWGYEEINDFDLWVKGRANGRNKVREVQMAEKY